ncbi:MAG: hypothetical protein IJ304_01775 [Clostridia bacterium]|nr:hypothetical protein [Clostridia bacterium]
MIAALLLAFIAKDFRRYISVILMLVVVVALVELLVVAIYKLSKGQGLYIDGDKLFLKVFRKKYYNINDIAGILILKSQYLNCFIRSIDLNFLTNSNGENCYSIIYLTKICEDFETFSGGNIEFEFRYRKSVLFYTIYDEDTVKYFQEKNIPVIYPQNK